MRAPPQFFFRTANITGTLHLDAERQMVLPGDNCKVTCELLTPVALNEGMRFAFREGGRCGRGDANAAGRGSGTGGGRAAAGTAAEPRPHRGKCGRALVCGSLRLASPAGRASRSPRVRISRAATHRAARHSSHATLFLRQDGWCGRHLQAPRLRRTADGEGGGEGGRPDRRRSIAVSKRSLFPAVLHCHRGTSSQHPKNHVSSPLVHLRHRYSRGRVLLSSRLRRLQHAG